MEGLLRLGRSDPFAADLKRLSKLKITDDIPNPVINASQIEGHLHLLEHIASTKERVDDWAGRHGMTPGMAWRLYISSAVPRLTKWLQYVNWGSVTTVVPPSDILIVWHAFMQDAVQWNAFTKATGLKFESWNWIDLNNAFSDSEYGDLFLSETADIVAEKLFVESDLLKLLTTYLPLILDRLPPATRSRDDLITFKTPNGPVEFRFDFYNAVNSQLEFARRMSWYSWHRIDVLKGPLRKKWRLPIERYGNFMGLRRYWHTITYTPSLSDTSMIPAEDIDLVWRTHLLLPEQYHRFSHNICRDLIPHISSVPKERENWSSYLSAVFYAHVFKSSYNMCFCWTCIAGGTGGCFGGPSSKRLKNLKYKMEREKERRKAAWVSTTPWHALKQCSKCGSHPGKECKPEHALQLIDQASSNLEATPTLPELISAEDITTSHETKPPVSIAGPALSRSLARSWLRRWISKDRQQSKSGSCPALPSKPAQSSEKPSRAPKIPRSHPRCQGLSSNLDIRFKWGRRCKGKHPVLSPPACCPESDSECGPDDDDKIYDRPSKNRPGETSGFSSTSCPANEEPSARLGLYEFNAELDDYLPRITMRPRLGEASSSKVSPQEDALEQK